MKLCLCFHCLCESYEGLTGGAEELFVSLDDMRDLIEQIQTRGYRFSTMEDPADKTVAITFDDGYLNNLLFNELAQQYEIPYVVFVSSYYTLSGEGFPWLDTNGQTYEQMHRFDYYSHHQGSGGNRPAVVDTSPHRPLNFPELESLAADGLAEIGCHGYYHQPLSKEFEHYLQQEQSMGLSALSEHLNESPRYYSMANGMYNGRVVRELLKTFAKVFTIDGMPYRRNAKVVHRLTLTNPNVGGPLLGQIDKALSTLRQIKRTIRTRRRLFS